ncbi:hypothetical protein PGT21_010768 [Puccinia graminis f. sp. tritici]|uniref:hAT-like transposase RNase-H fold domain-containing protein n=1 Tax=Puccinia graminis f. sp. tritici TaxID=56615 RepID=A0A5B0MKT3_PUCGR|nr:hypothetical protein PGT21_010768 [Puccinia graminis f. sp. tritici]
MIKELSRLIKEHDGKFWDDSINHQQCFCHVLALILSAGLTAIKLSTAEGPTSQRPDGFPALQTITKEGELIDNGNQDSDEEEEIDPDDVSEAGSQPDESQEVITKKSKGKYATSGIGFTLKKVTHVTNYFYHS